MEVKKCMFDFENMNFFEIKNSYKAITHIPSQLLYGIRLKNCKVSIMIPTYLRNEYLIETIDSALRQTTDVIYEVVIVDNNADLNDSGTLNIVRKYDPNKVCYYKNEENLGMFGNWNRCVELAQGDWVLILHDDDLIKQDYLEKMLSVSDKYPEMYCIGCDHYKIDAKGVQQDSNKSFLGILFDIFSKNKFVEITLKDMYFSHPIDIMGCLLNRKAAIEVGGFDERWYPISDYILLLNMAARGKILHIGQKIFCYRIAVNISYRIEHVVGCLEADIAMKKSINQKMRFVSDKKDILFRSVLENLRERDSFVGFGSRLTADERKKVRDEFKLYKKNSGLYDVNRITLDLYKWFLRWYIFKIKCINGKKIKC